MSFLRTNIAAMRIELEQVCPAHSSALLAIDEGATLHPEDARQGERLALVQAPENPQSEANA